MIGGRRTGAGLTPVMVIGSTGHGTSIGRCMMMLLALRGRSSAAARPIAPRIRRLRPAVVLDVSSMVLLRRRRRRPVVVFAAVGVRGRLLHAAAATAGHTASSSAHAARRSG